MEPVIAIHGMEGWASKWVEYCKNHNIRHEVVNCYRTDIVDSLSKFNCLMWHFSHWSATDLMMARNILQAIELAGLHVFPNTKTCWHFDDKVAQKYALEAIHAPVVPSYAFFDKAQAFDWLSEAEFPIVAKLRRGAGSYNVKLLKTKGQAIRHCRRAFGKGFSAVPGYLADLGTKARKAMVFGDVVNKLKRAPGFFRAVYEGRRIPRERGYAYFQKFLSGNTFDTRISVIGDRAWGFTRNVRKNDWRASGSGSICYDLDRIDLRCVEIAFKAAKTLGSQSIAFDFVKDENGNPKIVEISFGFEGLAVFRCEGHWNSKLEWLEGNMWPEYAVLEDVISSIRNQ